MRRLSDIVKELDLAVHSLAAFPEINSRQKKLNFYICLYIIVCVTSIKMEVGIEDCLHIEFEYNKSK